jgi:hypothetical protein
MLKFRTKKPLFNFTIYCLTHPSQRPSKCLPQTITTELNLKHFFSKSTKIDRLESISLLPQKVKIANHTKAQNRALNLHLINHLLKPKGYEQ